MRRLSLLPADVALSCKATPKEPIQLREGLAGEIPSHEGDMPADPLIGTTLDGRFEILEIIGEGCMGGVYRARQLSQALR